MDNTSYRSVVMSPERHALFASLSGDYNPMHMDAVEARRTQAGAPIVHGMHTLLWLLDCVMGWQGSPLPLATVLKARLLKMVYVGDLVECELLQQSAATLRARALVGGVEVVRLTLEFLPSTRTFKPPSAAQSAAPPPAEPVDLAIGDLAGRNGRLLFAGPADSYRQMFARAIDYLGASRVAALGSSSCLVGMVVPGLHSVYGGLDLLLTDDNGRTGEIEYEVVRVDQGFRLVHTMIRGAGVLGMIESASRLPPVQQPCIAELASHIDKDHCRDTRALVVGGSRGIGELTAKLIAAGGGHVTISYCSGRSDAEAVAGEIREWGGSCDLLRYDARQASAPQLAELSHPPDQVYYFATPMIAARKSGLCDPRRLAEFNAFYVTGFLDLAQTCHRMQPHGVAMFYPSSVYVESRPADMTEYAMSKAAGEVLCADLAKYLPRFQVLCRRLPRLPTDQTSSLLPIQTANPLSVMLPILKEMQSLNRKGNAGET